MKVAPERHRGAAVLAGIASRLGHRRVSPTSSSLRAWLRRGGAVGGADPADQRDAADRNLAVFGDDGDGARSDLHLAARGAGFRRRWAARTRSTAPSAPKSRACAGCRASSTSRCAGSRTAGCADRSIDSCSIEVSRGTPRATRFDAFCATQAWWLDEYALFRALHAHHDERKWSEWPEPLARADRDAVRAAPAIAAPRNDLSIVPAMARGRAVGRGPAARLAVARLRRSAVHDLGRQSRRVGAAERISFRRHHRRPARCVQRNRTGLGPAAVAHGHHEGVGATPGCAIERGATQPLRRLPHRSPGRPLSNVRAAHRRQPTGILRSGS